MSFDSDKMISLLFKNIPDSKKTDKVKESISIALSNEYERIVCSKNEIQAAGEIMQKYGTLEEAAAFAGLSEKQIEDVKSPSSAVELKEVKRIFRRQRMISYAAAFAFAELINGVISIKTYFSSFGLIFTVAFLLLFLASILFYHRSFNAVNEIIISSKSSDYIKMCSDSYSKKLVNSIFLGCIFAFYFAVILFYIYCSSKTKDKEVLEQVYMIMGYFVFALYLVFKNFLCRNICRQYVTDKINKPFFENLKFVIISSAVYGFVLFAVMALLIKFNSYSFNVLSCLILVYAVLALGYNFILRDKTVFRNFRVNLKRAIIYVLAFAVLFVYQFMGMDSYLIQPYISSAAKIEREPYEITYNDETGVYTITAEKDSFRILQLTDIHLGGSIVSADKDLKALETVYNLIEYSKPDFVAVTGDLVFPMGIMSFSRNNATPIVQFADFMRNIDVPWAFTYGNHDTEAMATETAENLDNIMKSVSFKTSGNFLYPYVQPDIWGRNNQLIEVRNTDGTLRQALFFIDSNAYVEGAGINEYDYIHDDQVQWYERQINKLSEKEGKIVKSMAFFHIPLQEYQEAYELYQQGSEDVKYYYGIIGETMINPICCSDYPSAFFDKALELGSTKAMFCGHDHYNNLSVEYKGIRLTYGYSIDYLAMPGIENDIEQRGATVIDIDKSGNFEITPVQYKNIIR